MSNSNRQLWYEAHLLGDESGRIARQRCIALGARVHNELLDIGDRLARESAVLAQRFYCQAALAYEAFAGDFDRWVAIGEDLATGGPTVREGAAAYFSIPVPLACAVGIDGLERWAGIGTRIARESRKQAAVFFETTAPLLQAVTRARGRAVEARPERIRERRDQVLDRMQAWAGVALRLHTQHGWHGEFLAQAFLNAAPRALFTFKGEQYSLWAGLGVSLRRVMKESEFFARIPGELRRWSDADRSAFLRIALSVAVDAPKAAALFYREAPRALRSLPPGLRAPLLITLETAGRALANTIGDLVPVLGAVVLDVRPDDRAKALVLAERVAAAFPRAAAAILRSLPKAFEETDAEGVVKWVEQGLRIAGENAEAGVAYFALESRTSLKILRAGSTGVALAEVQGLLRKLIQMLSGDPTSIRSLDFSISLRPPLEEFPMENEVTLPLRIDCLSTHENNARLYRVLAAWLAGRREFGTYRLMKFGGSGSQGADGEDSGFESGGAGVVAYLRREERPELLEELFLLTDGYRVARRLVAEYPGLAEDFRWAAAQLLERWTAQSERDPDASTVLDATLALALSASDSAKVPVWLAASAPVVLPCLVPLGAPTATVADAVRVAEELAARLLDPNAPRRLQQDQFEFGGLLLDRVTGETIMDYYYDIDDEAPPPLGDEVPRSSVGIMEDPDSGLVNDRRLQLDPTAEDTPAGARPLSLEELRRLLEQGADLKIQQGTGEETDGIGLYITDLIGKIPSAQLEELRRLIGEADRPGGVAKRWLEDRTSGPCFVYDEWDYHIGDYRSRWCRLHEISLEGDGGEFFNEALVQHAAMIPGVRQQFQKIRPEMYRVVRGLEDGEDFDLNAAVAARVETRARRSPSNKLYVARKREERDVATLFLLDMSASTDEPLEKPPSVHPPENDDWQAALRGRIESRAPRRIIDVTKEALVIMAQALDEIGDAYAIYGFSGQGRDNVEFYLVKSFSEQLSSGVKSRIGGIEPKRSTRMGTALRHAIEKMNAVNSRSKHLILLSDGFPQDFDYGQDRRSNVYGIRDTSVALRETEAAGITPFCITVDRAGHDYLRQMCNESRYMVIEDVATLPKELPKIYQRVVRAD